MELGIKIIRRDRSALAIAEALEKEVRRFWWLPFKTRIIARIREVIGGIG